MRIADVMLALSTSLSEGIVRIFATNWDSHQWMMDDVPVRSFPEEPPGSEHSPFLHLRGPHTGCTGISSQICRGSHIDPVVCYFRKSVCFLCHAFVSFPMPDERAGNISSSSCNVRMIVLCLTGIHHVPFFQYKIESHQNLDKRNYSFINGGFLRVYN